MAHPNQRTIQVTSRLLIPYPILAVAPMVGQCDLPFRELCRRHGSNLAYTEMLKAEDFVVSERYRRDALGREVPDSGPLFVQFCSRNPSHFAEAARLAMELGAAGADLNLGCPQLRAQHGRYGAFLADEVELCGEIVRAARAAVEEWFAITVKIRLRPTREETVDFARQLVAAGASLVTLHARPRGRLDARRDCAADLETVRLLVEALDVPVLSNGNVRQRNDVYANLEYTKAAGCAVAEALLESPALFSPLPVNSLEILRQYLDLCTDLQHLIPRDDWSVWQKHGALSRASSRPADNMRYSNWWSNCECVRQHVKRILLPLGQREVLQRNTFRKATCVTQIEAYLRGRLSLPRLRSTEGPLSSPMVATDDGHEAPLDPADILASAVLYLFGEP